MLVVKKPLDYETLSNFSVTLRAQDAGSPPLHNDTVLQVQVLDADDQNPKFSHEHYTAVLPEDGKEVRTTKQNNGTVNVKSFQKSQCSTGLLLETTSNAFGLPRKQIPRLVRSISL